MPKTKKTKTKKTASQAIKQKKEPLKKKEMINKQAKKKVIKKGEKIAVKKTEKKAKKTVKIKAENKAKAVKKKIRNKKENSIFSPEKVMTLIKKGKQRGFVTASEILYFFPDVEKDIEGLEALYDELDRYEIEIKWIKEYLELEVDSKKKKTSPRVSKARIDPIQIYLKEIGKVSFLTADQEKELSKKNPKRGRGGKK